MLTCFFAFGLDSPALRKFLKAPTKNIDVIKKRFSEG
jgi:hypothetical protein